MNGLHLMNKVENRSIMAYLLSLFTENVLDATYQWSTRTRPA
jgi:hypothetical protein